jgi:hypothetical protein
LNERTQSELQFQMPARSITVINTARNIIVAIAPAKPAALHSTALRPQKYGACQDFARL